MKIEKYDSLADYIAAQTIEGDLAAVPISLVAEYLEVTPPAVTAMLTDGRLNAVRIGRSTLVTLASLQARQTKRAGEVSTVYKYLRGLAKNGTRSVFYEPVMTLLGMSPRVPADRSRIGGVLGEVSVRSFNDHHVLLSVLVHQKKAGVTRPGKGFFELAKQFGFSVDDPDKLVKDQTSKVLAVYR